MSKDGISVDPMKVNKVQAWPIPKTIQAVREFLGFCSYCHRSIQKFAQITKPLYKLTEQNAKFKWRNKPLSSCTIVCQSTPILAHPDFSREFMLDTNASDTGIGAVLSQEDDQGKERVIAYGSQLLSKPEWRCCGTRRELLAVVFFVNKFRPYLLGKYFKLQIDHGALTWFMSFKEPKGHMARWLEKLQEYDFEIKHRSGRKHTNADALSRLPCKQCGYQQSHSTDHDYSTFSVVSLNQLQIYINFKWRTI